MHRTFRQLAIALPLAATSLGASAAAMMVSDCWIRSMPGETPSGGYFKLMNMSSKPIDLDGIHTEAFGMSALHQTLTSGSTSKMVPIEKVTIAANSTFAFAPGGYHAMFEKPKASLAVGSTVPVTFKFSDGDRIEAKCAVKSATGQ
ncbi:copper chaperone PCu(A)C [Paraburkholderia denitrificans]|uniref:Copper chaperone PCu(A)C n=1 Tax=Paraburkholderia denitrificans TaxID=694025 RepID=A0ABW0JC50_9BURK